MSPGRRRRALLAVAAAVVLSAGVTLLIARAVRFEAFGDVLRAGRPGWLVLCVAGEALAYAGYVLSYQAVAAVRGGVRLPFGLTLHAVAISLGAFSLATAAGGLSVDYWALREAGRGRADTAVRVLALHTLHWAVLAPAVALAAAIALAAGIAPAGIAVPWIAAVPFCFAAAAWITAPARRRLAEPEGGRVRRALALAVRGLLLLRALAAHRRGEGPRAVTGAVLYWAGDLLCLWGALAAFGAPPGPAALVVAYATAYVTTALPLPAGGSGGLEAAMTFALHAVGVPLGPALAGALAFRVFNFWLPIVPALLVAPTIGRLRERLRRAGGARDAGEAPGA